MEIDTVTMVVHNFEQAGHSSWTRVRQHQGMMLYRRAGAGRGVDNVFFRVRGGEYPIDGIDELNELRVLAITGLRQVDREVRMDVGRVAAQHDNAVGEDHGFFDVVGDDEDGASGNFRSEE